MIITDFEENKQKTKCTVKSHHNGLEIAYCYLINTEPSSENPKTITFQVFNMPITAHGREKENIY
jgi:hypothetical protein